MYTQPNPDEGGKPRIGVTLSTSPVARKLVLLHGQGIHSRLYSNQETCLRAHARCARCLNMQWSQKNRMHT